MPGLVVGMLEVRWGLWCVGEGADLDRCWERLV